MMSTKMQIQNLNQKIIDEKVEINIVDYVKLLNYEVYHIDISFIDDFINLVDKDECCVHHDMLYKYGVLTKRNSTHDTLRIIENQKLETETNLFSCRPCINAHLTESHQAKNEYFLPPRLFKLILIRSRNNDTYAKYYIFLEEAIKHYSDFQVMKPEDKVNKKSTISILNLIDKDTLDRFVMAKNISNKEYPYLNIRGQERHIRKVMKKCEIPESDILIDLNVPHAINFLINVKKY